MSDADPPRVADVRPARVWQPSDLMSTTSRPDGFVQHAWANSASKNYWVQEVITETLLLKASAPGDEDLSESEEADATGVAGHGAGLDDVVTDVQPKSEQIFTDEFLEQVRAESYAKGAEEARQSLRAEIEAELLSEQTRDQSLVESLQIALDTLKLSPQPFYEPLKRLALHLAEQLVLAELALDGKTIDRLVQRCIDELDSHSESLILVELNPSDMVLFSSMQERAGPSLGPALRLQADASLMPGSVRTTVNDAIVEDLIENRLAGLARALSIDEKQWKTQTGFEPTRLSEERASTQKTVEDASPRMASAQLQKEQAIIDELLGEDRDDA
jgi:flagellar biosynthesis/type III secretory pathway protein FliH